MVFPAVRSPVFFPAAKNLLLAENEMLRSQKSLPQHDRQRYCP
jgi:hypothetical protein